MIRNTPIYMVCASICCLLLSMRVHAQVDGCTDPAANNFNPLATRNNGTCTYNGITLSPSLKSNLVADLIENSGIIYWNNMLWTHNDGGSAAELIEMDTLGNITRKVAVSNAQNIDWEDIAQDENYVYIGDFGNNASGNRTDLKIYRVLKSDLSAGNSVSAEEIGFSYADQTDFTPVDGNTTNFDCEAMIVFQGKIFLFLKQWSSLGTAVYELPNVPGTYSANRISTSAQPSNWLVTGADVMPDQRSIILCGYSATTGSRYLYLLYDFAGTDFFSGNERTVNISGFGQTEGIAFKNPEYVFLSRERRTVSIFTFAQALEAVNLTALLKPYYQVLPISLIKLALTNGTMSTRIHWEIMPEDEFHTGWLQQRNTGDQRFQNLYAIPTAKGWYEDPVRTVNTYYRIKVIDKNGNETYSKEQVRKARGSNTSLTRSGQVIRATSSDAMVVVYAMSGNVIAKSAGEASIAQLPQGSYFAVCIDGKGEITDRMMFIR